jgi:hypothetical protein
MKKILFGVVFVFCLFGVIFVSTLMHEIFHVIHAHSEIGTNSAKSICVDMNLKTYHEDEVQEGYFVAHTVFDVSEWDNIESFNSWRELSEKWAGLIQTLLQVTFSAVLGAIGAFFIYSRK